MQPFSGGRLRLLPVAAVLCVLCLLTPPSLQLFARAASPAQHVAQFARGTLTTSAGGSKHPSVSLQGTSSEQATLVVLGVPDEADHDKVLRSLEAVGGSLMEFVPPTHWLIHATPAAVARLLQQHPDLTQAELPAAYKIGTHYELLQQALAEDQQDSEVGRSRLLAETSTHPEEEAPVGGSRWRSRSTSALSSFATTTAAGGAKMVHLQVMGVVTQPLAASSSAASSSSSRGDSAAQRQQQAPMLAWANKMQSGLAAHLAAQLEGGSTCSVHVRPAGSSGQVEVTVCAQGVHAATTWLAAQRDVMHVAPKLQMRPLNLHNGALLQSGKALKSSSGGYDLRKDPSLFPYWAVGLDGTGHTVGVVDTGIDMRSCYFYDPRFKDYATNSKNLQYANITDYYGRFYSNAYFKNTSARKVTHYYPYLNDWEDMNGHGTHTAGSVAGACYGSDAVKDPDYATGLAPKAKLAFMDVHYDEFANDYDDGDFDPPVDPDELFGVMYADGVRVQSNSWGSSYYGYSQAECGPWDKWLWQHQDMTVLMAAGNDGDIHNKGFTTGTVGSPATCKNVVAVGASQARALPLNEKTPLRDYISKKQNNIPDSMWKPTVPYRTMTIDITHPDGKHLSTMRLSIGYHAAAFRAPNDNLGQLGNNKAVELVLADPFYDCTTLNNPKRYKDKIMVFGFSSEYDSCSADEWAANAKEAGAKGGLLLDLSGSLHVGRLSSPNNKLPIAYLSYLYAEDLLAYLQYNFKVTMSITSQSSPYEGIAPFSSYGPAPHPDPAKRAIQDLRIKPEIVAPGTTLSAYTSGQGSKYSPTANSDAVTYQGTSMATPLAAGATTIIRQYFTDGFYPTGARSGQDSHQPSAPLVRAMLLSGAATLSGNAPSVNLDLKSTPDQYQGYGRLDLSRSLPLKGDSRKWRLQVLDAALVNTTNKWQQFTVTATGKGPLVVTLCWHDWPAAPGVAPPLLVNDLDLRVVGPSVKGKAGQSYWGNMGRSRDNVNNNERVVIDRPTAGTYTVSVRASRLFALARQQRYALVVLGGFKGTLQSPYNPAA